MFKFRDPHPLVLFTEDFNNFFSTQKIAWTHQTLSQFDQWSEIHVNQESWVGAAAMATDQENFLIVKKLLGWERGPQRLAGLLKMKQDILKSQSWGYILVTETIFNMFDVLMYFEFD